MKPPWWNKVGTLLTLAFVDRPDVKRAYLVLAFEDYEDYDVSGERRTFNRDTEGNLIPPDSPEVGRCLLYCPDGGRQWVTWFGNNN